MALGFDGSPMTMHLLYKLSCFHVERQGEDPGGSPLWDSQVGVVVVPTDTPLPPPLCPQFQTKCLFTGAIRELTLAAECRGRRRTVHRGGGGVLRAYSL